MKKYSKYLLVAFTIILIIIFSYLKIKDTSKKDIDVVLETKAYSYLNTAAKNFIKEIYEETGEIINTEKNKVYNQAYLNPEYITYLGLNESIKEEYYAVPEIYVYDTDTFADANETYPSYFTLKDYNGTNYTTALQSQGSLGLCWAFATFGALETNILLSSNKGYSNETLIFSKRQMDYATSTNGISDYANEYGHRELGSGGTFLIAASMLSMGLSGYKNSDMPYNSSKTQKTYAEVFDTTKMIYEVDSTDLAPNYPTNAALVTEYLNLIKENILKYGSAYVATQAPTYSCSTVTESGYYLIRRDNKCEKYEGSHAMQIIGWDDNFEYSYCSINETQHTTKNCNENETITGKGAWILQNSWGSSIPYLYLAYDSENSEINFVSSTSSEKNYDNMFGEKSYYKRINTISTMGTTNITRETNDSIKVEKIKVLNLSTNGQFNISINSESTDYDNIKSVKLTHYGINTIDLSDLNITIEDKDFSVTMETTNNSYIRKNSIIVFTSNINKQPEIETKDIDLKDVFISNENTTYSFEISHLTKNIPFGSNVLINIYKNDINVTNNFKLIKNQVLNNKMNIEISFDETLLNGKYIVEYSYNDYVVSYYLNIDSINLIEGKGTTFNPYIINSENDLKAMNYYPSATFKLGTSITLSDNFKPLGSIENPFVGKLDGNKFSINNLHLVSSAENESMGFFNYIGGSSKISNIVFNDPYIETTGDAGVIAANLNGKTITLENIYINGGYIKSTSGYAGALIGSFNYNETSYISSVVVSSVVSGNQASGLLGQTYDMSSNKILYISNVLNTGSIDIRDNNPKSNNAGLLVGFVNSSIINANNMIFTGKVLSNSNVNNTKIFGYLLNEYYFKSSVFQKIYYTYGVGILKGNCTNVEQITFDKLTNDNLYSTWNNWNIKTIDNIKRIPVVKTIDYNYSSVDNNITILTNETYDITNSIMPDIDAAKNIIITDYDSNYLDINNTVIIPKKEGTTTIRINNYYDGYEGNITVNIKNAKLKLIYNSNTNNNETNEFIVNYNSNNTVIDNTYNNIGYSFIKWNTKKDGTGISYTKNSNIIVTKDTILYAVWQENEYNIYFYKDKTNYTSYSFKYTESIDLSKYFNDKDYTLLKWCTNNNGTGTCYNSNEILSKLSTQNNDIIKLYAITEKKISLDIEIYNYEIDNSLVYINPNTLITNYISNYSFDKNLTVKYYLGTKELGGNELLGTGSVVKFYNGNDLVKEYTNVIKGDVNGDGTIGIIDYIRIMKDIMGTNKLTGAYSLAADINKNDKIDIIDYIRIMKIIMEETK